MNDEIHMHDVVAVLEDLPANHFASGHPLTLRRGQMGTVVMIYGVGSVEVEFSGPDGRAFAMLPVPTSKLMVLRDQPEPELAVAR